MVRVHTLVRYDGVPSSFDHGVIAQVVREEGGSCTIVRRQRPSTGQVDFFVLYVADTGYPVFKWPTDGEEEVQEPVACYKWMTSVGEVLHDSSVAVPLRWTGWKPRKEVKVRYSLQNYPDLAEWMRQFKENREGVKSLVLWGASRTAKTLFARSLGSYCYFSRRFDVEEYDDRCEYVVFDDMEDGVLSIPYRDWLGKKESFAVEREGSPPQTIRWGRPCVFVQSEHPLVDSRVDRQWMKENVVIVDVMSPLCDYE